MRGITWAGRGFEGMREAGLSLLEQVRVQMHVMETAHAQNWTLFED